MYFGCIHHWYPLSSPASLTFKFLTHFPHLCTSPPLSSLPWKQQILLIPFFISQTLEVILSSSLSFMSFDKSQNLISHVFKILLESYHFLPTVLLPPYSKPLSSLAWILSLWVSLLLLFLNHFQ